MKTRIIAIALTVIFVLACLVSCGANKATEEMAASESDGYYAGEKTSQSDSYSLLEKGSDITVPTGRKIIENVSMSVETIDFDALMEKVEKETAKLGG